MSSKQGIAVAFKTVATLLMSLWAATSHAATELYYVHADHLGTPQVMTDKNQDVVWKSSQTPFGETVEESGTLEQPLRFPGQYQDRETGFSYNYYRDYDPSLGRYVQSDPIGLQGGLNTYAYASANPISNWDLYGLWWDSLGINFTFVTHGKGTSTSFSFASDGNGLYCTVTHQELSGTGYYYAGGGEAAGGSGDILPSDADYFTQYTSNDGQGAVGGVANPIPIKGAFGFSGGITEENGEISSAVGRRGPGVGAFAGKVDSQSVYRYKIAPDFKINLFQ